MNSAKAWKSLNAVVLGAIPGLLVALSAPAEAASFSKLYVFGDSLSDTGNSLAFTANTIPPSFLGYANGRFSNGDNWIDVLAPQLGLSVPPISAATASSPIGVNFAINSATTGTQNTFPSPFPFPLPGFVGVTTQVSQFLNNNTPDPNALYILWAGANDYLGGGVTDPSVPVTNLSKAVQNLFDAGARNFLVANLPNLGATPLATSRGLSAPLSQVTTFHNLLLGQALSGLQLLPGINLKALDVASLFNAAIANPSQFGFTNITEPCLKNSPLFPPLTGLPSLCNNPNEYLFFDDIHPTEAAYKLVGNQAFEILQDGQAVPESSPAVALLTLGAIVGIGAAQKPRKALVETGDRVLAK
ncbi:MAG: SGNH/GDSL hydrolase family protein [Leptolyngbyaceae cyanobacterium bins.59]|nr:SGNH/GDSL hydrolase family protein [Leptolyngbyaceae cyanobacterium bins.59]